ncbi:MAG: hypothetical protein LKCHEGNO_02364 [Burkholderiaceae bacterium]|nr:hypothetical protein [Burkholderiaceae bacterium]
METSFESSLQDRRLFKTMTAGSTAEALGGAAAVVLAIVGLAGIAPEYMPAIAAIVVGAALLAQASLIAAEAREIEAREHLGGTQKLEFEGGISSEALAGGVAIVLGILALLGIGSEVLVSIAAIVIGAALILEFGAMNRLNALDVPNGKHLTVRRMARRAVMGSEGAQMLVGLAAVVLGILALIGVGTAVLNLVALLAIGVAILLAGTALGGRSASLLVSSS